MRLLPTFLSLLLIPFVVAMPIEAEMSPAAVVSAAGEPSVPTTTPSAQTNALQIRLADSGKAVVEASSSDKGYAFVVTDSSGLPVSDVAVAVRLPEDGATGFFADGAHSAVAYTDASGIANFPQVNWGSNLGTVSIRVTVAKGQLHAGALIEQTIVAQSAASKATAQRPVVTPISQVPAPSVAAAKTTAPTPGTPATVASVRSGATAEQAIPTTETAASAEPVVSIVNTSGNKGSGHSNRKWIVIALVAAGAGAGIVAALGMKGGGGTTPTSTTGISVGAPTISVGH